MPQLDVCLWNIQNYGQASGKYDGTGANNALRNRFIAAFVVEHQIDVLMIMEMQPGMDAALGDLVTKLNAAYTPANRDWAYSYCGCAIANNGVDVVAGPADLIDRTGARSECYAVVWRYNRAHFTMIDAIAQIGQGTSVGRTSPLNISQRGRPTGDIPIGIGRSEFSAMGGFERAQVYPYEWNGVNAYQLMNNWPKLNYPLTGNMQNLRPAWAGSRRPAYVVVQLNDAHHTLAPVMAYHAPSKQVRASWGAFMTGLARELYVIDNVDGHNQPTPAAAPVLANYGFVGGDFNYSVNGDRWPSDYAYFTSARGQEYDTGAFQETTPDPTAADEADRRTTVQIVNGANHDQPIVSPNTNAYLSYKIDLGFNRQIPEITSARVDLLTEIIANPAGRYDTAMTGAAAYMDHLVANVAAPLERMTPTGPQKRGKRGRDGNYIWTPLICGGWAGTFTNWNAARNQYAAHNITTARRAAEFIHLFVSDHLPLISTFIY